jgi:hypothetical protein
MEERMHSFLGHNFQSGVSSGAIVHRVPQVPIMIDEKECDPRTVHDLDGIPLHTMLDGDALEGKMLKIFSNPLQARDFVRSGSLTVPDSMQPNYSVGSLSMLNPPPLGSGAQPYSYSFNGFIELYEHVDLGGCMWRFIKPTVEDFTKEWACGFLWWGHKNLNDVTSSLDVAIVNAAEFVLCEHIWWGGSWLHMPPKVRVYNLVPFGWNDKASSYRVHI